MTQQSKIARNSPQISCRPSKSTSHPRNKNTFSPGHTGVFFPPLVPVILSPVKPYHVEEDKVEEERDIKPDVSLLKKELEAALACSPVRKRRSEEGRLDPSGIKLEEEEAIDQDTEEEKTHRCRDREKAKRQLEREKTRQCREKEEAKRKLAGDETEKFIKEQFAKRQQAREERDSSTEKGRDLNAFIEIITEARQFLHGIDLHEIKNDQEELIYTQFREIRAFKKKKKKSRELRCRKCANHGHRSGIQHRSAGSRGYRRDCRFENCKCPPCRSVDAANLHQNQRNAERTAAKWRKEQGKQQR